MAFVWPFPLSRYDAGSVGLFRLACGKLFFLSSIFESIGDLGVEGG